MAWNLSFLLGLLAKGDFPDAAAEIGVPEDDPRCAALARFAVEATALAQRSDDPERTVEAAFDLLENGWHAGK